MRVLFLGENIADGSARYVSAILRWAKIRFDHRPDGSRLPKPWRGRGYDAVILSDYRYASWTPCAREWLTESVQGGTGLLMIGGWASFTGLVGRYAGTTIEKLLPVRCFPGDDRVNRPAVLSGGKGRLRWSTAITEVVLSQARARFCSFAISPSRPGNPGWVPPIPRWWWVRRGKGRTAAFLSDCAPHWAGGLVDWGKKRVRIGLGGGQTVEVGEAYLHFFTHWITWVAHRRK